MKKLKSNKKKLIILSIIIILFIGSVATFVCIKNDLFKNKNNEITEKNQENNDINNNLESDKIEDEKKEESTNPSEENNEGNKDNKVDKEESNSTKPNNKEEKPSNNTTTNKPTTNNNNSNNTNKPNNTPENKPNNDTNNNENNNNPETEKPEEKPVTPPVVEDKNNTKRKNMESTYGIKILYGDEIGDYHPRGITPTRLTSESDIDKYLTRLNGELTKYPKGFFNDFKKAGMPLTIYLVKSVNGAFAGFTDYQFMSNIKLTLVTNYNFEYTIHHELMHYIDCYLDIKMYPNEPYSEYEALNPSGFVYGSAKEEYIYNMASRPRGTYFVTSYSTTHVKEDRAEIFQYMTARAYAPIGCFEPNEVIRKKAEIISKQIKTYFPSVTGTTHWDRFIK